MEKKKIQCKALNTVRIIICAIFVSNLIFFALQKHRNETIKHIRQSRCLSFGLRLVGWSIFVVPKLLHCIYWLKNGLADVW